MMRQKINLGVFSTVTLPPLLTIMYKKKTNQGYEYYQDETGTIYMSIADYCLMSGKKLTSLAERLIDNTKIIKIPDLTVLAGLPNYTLVIAEKTIIKWLIEDKPEMIPELLVIGFRVRLELNQ